MPDEVKYAILCFVGLGVMAHIVKAGSEAVRFIP